MGKTKGKITIPTEVGLVDETLKIVEKWGADAIRDCDGVAIPDEILSSGQKIYSTYFVARGDNSWGEKVPNERIMMFLMSEHNIAKDVTMKIDIMKGYFKEQVQPCTKEIKKYWEVINRTTGEIVPVDSWTYDENSQIVTVNNVTPFNDYTVNFFAIQIWDSTQMYNYITNNWNIEKHLPYNAFCPKTSSYIVERMHKWLDDHPGTNVVRFTTFFYHFTLVFNDLRKEKFVDWFGYGASVSFEILEAFEKHYGYELRAEDFIDEGYYNSSFRIPSAHYLDYMDFVQQFVSKKAKELVDVVHSENREAMMFLGDNWIGTEPYGKYFGDIGIDAVVGSVGNGTTLRMISDIPHIKYSEGRFLPYFFPDTFYDGNEVNAVKELNENWLTARRAIMRSPVDRIGYGGYLSLALKFPSFVDRVEEICDEFRRIHDVVKNTTPYNKLKVGILNCWGKLRSWQTHMVAHALWYRQIYSYLGVLEALSGMAVDVEFLSFDDIRGGVNGDINVIINAGLAETAFSGGKNWLDTQVLSSIRKYVLNGGGFIGIGEPTAILNGGHYFQLFDVLGVDKELSFTLSTDKYNTKTEKLELIAPKDSYDLGEPVNNIYALSARILYQENDSVKIAVNDYGLGRGVYISGLPYSSENSDLLLRAMLYSSHREKELKVLYCDNVNVECSYYPDKHLVAIINNTLETQKTNYYDRASRKLALTLAPCEIKWIED